jgi:N-acetyl-D-muramate 6-phosphate phosphatase
MIRPPFEAVLFDLDGTLVDSAPDMAVAANRLRDRHGLTPLPAPAYRAHVGSGARGMLKVAFGLQPVDDRERFDQLKTEFLALYAEALLVHTALFEGMADTLDHLQASGVPWGIVTNKARALAEPIVRGLPGLHGARVLIAGDTTAHTKPHPAPLLAAAEALGVAPQRCVFVGDDIRDVQCGRAAGSATLAAAWGYLGDGLAVDRWEADAVVAGPADVPDALKILRLP